MNFLQSAEILVPAFTDIPLTVYTNQQATLCSFERKYCFSVDVQGIYTAKALHTFFEKRSDEYIYEIREPMGTRITVFRAGEPWVLLGPYVHIQLNIKKAKDMFASLKLPSESFLPYQNYYSSFSVQKTEFAISTAFLLLEHTVGSRSARQVRVIETTPRQEKATLPSHEVYEDPHVINQRYERERRFTQAVCRGDSKEALDLFQASKTEQFGLRFSSGNMRDQLAVAASIRTLIRTAAQQAGLTPVVIDTISQDYAIQMKCAPTVDELYSLLKKMVIHFCSIIQQRQYSSYSLHTIRVTQYIEMNLGKALSVAQLSNVAGISSDYLVRRFKRETGMTIKQYITKRRCEVAAGLLADSNFSIQEIAAHVGYEDRAYFARVFKEWSGVSPQKYRARYSEYDK